MSPIKILPVDDLEPFRALLERSREKPYRYMQDEHTVDLASYWQEEMISTLRDQIGWMFAAVQEGQLIGLVAYADLPWDSRLFGARMGTIKALVLDPGTPDPAAVTERLLDQVLDQAKKVGLDFLLCKTYTNDICVIHALERRGFLLVDTLLDFVYEVRRTPMSAVARPLEMPGVVMRQASASDLEDLLEIARASFGSHFGRYHADPRISHEQANAVYEEWIRSSLAGYADWVVVAEVEGRIAGYSIWKKPSLLETQWGIKMGHYSIAAIHPDYAARGLFGRLTYAGMELLDGIADYIEGPTHINNTPVQRGYARLQWRIADARHSFHLWLK